MKITKVVNNNLVISKNENGGEIILRGKGIGFGREKGDIVEQSQIERIFVPENSKESRYFQEIFSSIPAAYLNLCERIVELAPQYKLKLTDNVILPMCDHLCGLVSRYKEGLRLQNPMLWDIERLYPQEFRLGMKTIELIDVELGIKAERDEAGFFAFHFVSNQLYSDGKGDAMEIITLIKAVMDIVEHEFEVTLNKEEWNYQRFMTHLKFFANRILMNNQHETLTDEWFHIVRNKHPKVYQCVERIADYIHDAYFYEMNKEEMLYLMIHIERVIRRKE